MIVGASDNFCDGINNHLPSKFAMKKTCFRGKHFLFFSMAAAEMAPHSILDESIHASFTHDDENDEHRPITDATVTEEEGLVVQIVTKNVSDEEWNVYRTR